MPLMIEIADSLVEHAMEMGEDEKDFVEQIKAANAIDELIIAAGKKVLEQLAGLAAVRTPDARLQLGREVCDTLDLAVALIALAETVDEVEHIKRIATLLGRRHKKPVRVNQQEIWPALKRVFREVSESRDLQLLGPDDKRKAVIRRKVRAAIQIINESLANRRTRPGTRGTQK